MDQHTPNPAAPDAVTKTDHHPAAHAPGGCNGRCCHPLDCDHEEEPAKEGGLLGATDGPIFSKIPVGPDRSRFLAGVPADQRRHVLARIAREVTEDAIDWDQVCRSLVADARKGAERDTTEQSFVLDVLFESMANPHRRRQPERPIIVDVLQCRFGEELEYEMLKALGSVLRSNAVQVGPDGKLTALSVRSLLMLATSLVFGNIMGDDTGTIAERIELSRFGSDGRPVPPSVQLHREDVIDATAAKVSEGLATDPVSMNWPEEKGQPTPSACGCGLCDVTAAPLVKGGQGRPDYSPTAGLGSPT